MRCNDIMKGEVTSAGPETTVRDAARRMRDHNIGFLPICGKDGRVEGVITDRDICCRVVANAKDLDTKVGDYMSSEHLATVHPDDDLQRVQQVMANSRVGRVLVCDEHGRLRGVISLADLAQVADATQCMHTLKRLSAREVVGA
jgi:CBS domain-containing protein